MALKSSKHSQLTPFKIESFPDELWDVSKHQDFDCWFITTWKKHGAINIPANVDLVREARRLARATIRQAWWSALESQLVYRRQPAFADYKAALTTTAKLKTYFTDFLMFLQKRGEYSSGQLNTRTALTHEILLWLEASPLDEHGDLVKYGVEECATFASSLIEVQKFLDALEGQANTQIQQHQTSIQNVGRPELTAFTFPFVEAAIFMTGEPPAIGNFELANSITMAWSAMSAHEQTGWESQIRAARNLLSESKICSLKNGNLPFLLRDDVRNKLFT